MLRQLRNSARTLLQRISGLPGGNLLNSAAYSLVATARTGRPTLITKVGGGWRHRQFRDRIYDSSPRVDASPSMCESKTIDNWLHGISLVDGDVVIEIGAGIGENTLTFAKRVGPTGRVYAIEAHPRTFAFLEQLCEENSLTNVTPVLLAIHSSDNCVLITEGENFKVNAITDGDVGHKVAGSTLDGFLATYGISRVDLIKMNIEGAEAVAIAGMNESASLAKQIVVSCHDFLADRGGDESLRTQSQVRAYLEASGMIVRTREADDRDYIQYQLVATKPLGA